MAIRGVNLESRRWWSRLSWRDVHRDGGVHGAPFVPVRRVWKMAAVENRWVSLLLCEQVVQGLQKVCVCVFTRASF